MRKSVSLLILLLSLIVLSEIATAEQVQYAKINIEVINRPPNIKSLFILPDEPYYDSVLECNAIVDDEQPREVSFEYKWYKNDVLLEEKTGKLAKLNDNDRIKCEALPIDKYGEKGEIKTAEITILPSPIRVKIIKPILNMAGVKINAKELKESTEMSAITGMVTGSNGNSQITLFFLLGIFAVILIILNLFGLIMAAKRKKIKSPKEESSLS